MRVCGVFWQVALPANILNEITGSGAHIHVGAANIFSQQPHGDKLRADKDKQNCKQGEHTFRGPTRAVNKTQNQDQRTKAYAQQRNENTHDTEQAQWEGGHAGDKIELQVQQFPKAVFGFACLAMGMADLDLGCVAGKTVCQHWDERAALMTLQHGVNDVAAICPEHTAVIMH